MQVWPAKVKSFTGDMLAISVDPPAIYGMVQFESGGRLMADFTDCELDEIEVGIPVRMVFRRKSVDRERGFVNYFWKAVPAPGRRRTTGRLAASGSGAGTDHEAACPPALRPGVVILLAMLAAPGTSVLRNVYVINRGYEDLAERLNALGATIETFRDI